MIDGENHVSFSDQPEEFHYIELSSSELSTDSDSDFDVRINAERPPCCDFCENFTYHHFWSSTLIRVGGIFIICAGTIITISDNKKLKEFAPHIVMAEVFITNFLMEVGSWAMSRALRSGACYFLQEQCRNAARFGNSLFRRAKDYFSGTGLALVDEKSPLGSDTTSTTSYGTLSSDGFYPRV